VLQDATSSNTALLNSTAYRVCISRLLEWMSALCILSTLVPIHATVVTSRWLRLSYHSPLFATIYVPQLQELRIFVQLLRPVVARVQTHAMDTLNDYERHAIDTPDADCPEQTLLKRRSAWQSRRRGRQIHHAAEVRKHTQHQALISRASKLSEPLVGSKKRKTRLECSGGRQLFNRLAFISAAFVDQGRMSAF
jgi:hypothetical protein